ncbi:ATP-binding cassette domain-containing protein [Phaeobacter sp. QD34_3]|uniref:iron ABC transporter ATP-binding protein n=1 Tax=unclassified Phaeobacter TaxID=2621772 RepID=UPI00237F2086|nr:MULTISPECIES: ATP-binding cassette domain-containing protein [unclassified Phaeobacter]MDE4134505.1 ATP-binding cassette domain-containing protein [Phaeobacter sp. QD34_3]MDE4138164.1 ATP-binding cassette domain-containing protein [Phaeobacter sp. QD34_24]MDE4176612.1 ATP-binding cassette domain-containing protein [Phaeobacter sp. PT47_59]
MIDVQGVSYRIGSAQILRNVSLQLRRGGVIALAGPNGAGKSTLLSLVARLQSLQSGRIAVDDLEIGACDDRALARKLAILPQHVNASSRLTVRDLVGFGRYPHHRGRPDAQDRARVEEALQLFDLMPFAQRHLETLSGGQRQRAFVAMAYVQDTDFLLLDEPLNNLDLAASRALMAQLRDLADSKGRTVVIVLHDINYATAYADRIVVMKGGAVVADGAPREVVTEAMLRSVFETEARVEIAAGRPVVLV